MTKRHGTGGMGRGVWAVALVAIAVIRPSMSAQAPTSVTLFSLGRVLVRRTLPLALPAGVSTQPINLGIFESASLAALDAGVSIDGVRYDPAWSEEALLRRSVGKQFDFKQGTQTFAAQLVGLDPERWKLLANNVIVFGRPGQVQWAPGMVPNGPVADVSLRSDRARTGVRVMYATPGAGWAASYRVFLGAQGRVDGIASINGSTLDLENVEVQLLAGDIGRPVASPSPMYAKAMRAPMAAESNFADAAASNEAVGEAHLYTLPGHISFVPGVMFTAPLFDPTPARAEKKYSAAGGISYYGGFEQQPDEAMVPVEVVYRFERKTGTPFGDLTLPGGTVSVFDTDAAGRMQLIGQGGISHTPAGKELLIPIGTAFDITAKRVQTDYIVARLPSTPTTSSRTVGTATYRVTLQNAKDSAVVVEVREDRGGEWSVVDSSVPSQKRSSTRVVFPVSIPAKGTTVLTYRVRVVW